MSNIKILRLHNCSSNPKVIHDNDNSGFKYIVEPDLVNMGRCLVEVISGWSNITSQSIDNLGNVNGTSRIVPNNIPNLIIRGNILQEGEDTLTGGAGLILGTMNLQNTTASTGTTTTTGTGSTYEGVAGSTSSNIASFNQTQALSFICEKLPSQIHLERLYLTHTSNINEIPKFFPANNISLLNPPIVPFEVVLKLTFLDM